MKIALKLRASRRDAEIIGKIAKRAAAMAVKENIDYSAVKFAMDLTATHLNGCPLDLDGLLAAKDDDFGHDIFGVKKFLDRATGKLTECFNPRYTRKGDPQ